VSAPALLDRDRAGVEALVTDRYLEALLAGDALPSGADRVAGDMPAGAVPAAEVRAAARLLQESLVRVHPSFRFEERLAARLAGMAAAGQARAAAAGGGTGGTIVAFPGACAAAHPAADVLLDAILRGDLDPADAGAVERAGRTPGPRRPLLVGGAITSAAISIVGVAWVAWRASHPAADAPGGAMARAIRMARVRRDATVAAVPAGGLGGPA
jgi:hypothetical protein